MQSSLPRAPTKRGGRRSPPHDALIGRSEACRILGCEGRQFRRWIDRAVILPVLVERDEQGEIAARWFDPGAIRLLARQLQRLQRAAQRQVKPARAKRVSPSPPPGLTQVEVEPAKDAPVRGYRPEERLRDLVVPERPSTAAARPYRPAGPVGAGLTTIPREWLTDLDRPDLK